MKQTKDPEKNCMECDFSPREIYNQGKQEALKQVLEIIDKLDDYDMETVRTFKRELKAQLNKLNSQQNKTFMRGRNSTSADGLDIKETSSADKLNKLQQEKLR